MSRDRTIKVNAINIANAHESATQYTDMIRALYNKHISIRVRGDTHLVLSNLQRGKTKREPFTGTIARYTEIDPSEGWFDIRTLEPADDSDLKSLSIPENLRPNYASFFFRFYPEAHKFVFESYGAQGSISARQVLTFLEKALFGKDMVDQFGATRVNIVSSANRIKEILRSKGIRKLQITIDRPNPDDFGTVEQRVRDRFEKMNADQLTETTRAQADKSLKPDDETKELAQLASVNGKVEASVKVGHSPTKKISSESYPRQEIYTYDPQTTSDQTAFELSADKIVPPEQQ